MESKVENFRIKKTALLCGRIFMPPTSCVGRDTTKKYLKYFCGENRGNSPFFEILAVLTFLRKLLDLGTCDFRHFLTISQVEILKPTHWQYLKFEILNPRIALETKTWSFSYFWPITRWRIFQNSIFFQGKIFLKEVPF